MSLWQIVLKAPGSLKSIHIIDKEDEWKPIDINSWITSNLTIYSNVIFYNDDPPDKPPVSCCAHAKGVLTWNDHNIKWLIHSCPNWPENKTNFAFPKSTIIYGQSFILLDLPIVFLQDIIQHLEIMKVHGYNSTIGLSFDHGLKDFDLMPIDSTLWHVAKNRTWSKDIFDDALAPLFGGDIFAETWMRPTTADTKHVDNIDEIRWFDGTKYKESQDHSKYAFSINETNPFVYIGDLNHLHSQANRGGGGIIIKDLVLWKAFFSLVYKH